MRREGCGSLLLSGSRDGLFLAGRGSYLGGTVRRQKTLVFGVESSTTCAHTRGGVTGGLWSIARRPSASLHILSSVYASCEGRMTPSSTAHKAHKMLPYFLVMVTGLPLCRVYHISSLIADLDARGM